MRKLITLNRIAIPTAGRLAAVALACTLATACTTNVNPGAGEPTRSGPAAGPINPSVTPGTSFPTEVPMISSSFKRH
jgi:predicted small secreted protein